MTSVVADEKEKLIKEVQQSRTDLLKEWNTEKQNLISKLNEANIRARELERQKTIIRNAIVTGQYKQVDKERAKEYAKLWKNGYQYFPIMAPMNKPLIESLNKYSYPRTMTYVQKMPPVTRNERVFYTHDFPSSY